MGRDEEGDSTARVRRARAGRRATGREGEELAARHLERAGLRVLARNWTCRFGEIDLVCEEGAALVFVEVRTVRSHRFGRPEESIGPRKRARLIRAAQLWLAADAAPERVVRFDVVAVELIGSEPTVRHHRHAFTCDEDG